VALGADDEGLSAPLGHELVPRGLRLPGLCEIGELGDVMSVYRDADLLA
jgi:hypothetical protein